MKNQNIFTIPNQVLEAAHLPSHSQLTLSMGENTLVVLPERLTALQAANTIGVLSSIVTDLLCVIMEACGSCEEQVDGGCPFGCFEEPGECPYDDMDGPEVELSDAARKLMGIPLDAKLELFPDEGEGLVCAADYKHDITDVPENAMELFTMAGVCPGKLDELIMGEVEVWHHG